MIDEGEPAPSFALPAVRDGDVEQVEAADFFGEQLVILAFYPGDFNPACSESETGLDELDLFTMQKDVAVLAVSGDSVHSHRAFAAEYNLNMPLLADVDGSVADAYGVSVDDETAGYLTNRAVVVVDHTEMVQYAWHTAEPRALPNVDAIREAIEGIGDDETARSRYRVGHAHYIEGRRAFTSAMQAYENLEWMMAQADFDQAADEFDEAGEEFNTALRFAEDAEHGTYYERAERKAEALWRAADWLRDSASAFASGEGARAESLRSDAEAPLETARDIHEPVEPDEFPPEVDPAEPDESEPDHFVPDDGEEPAASLDADLDDELAGAGGDQSGPAPTSETDSPAVGDAPPSGSADSPSPEAGAAMTRGGDSSVGGSDSSSDDVSDPDVGADPSDPTAGTPSDPAAAGQTDRSPSDEQDPEGGMQIDEEELEEITAELEEQSAAADENDSSERDDGEAGSADEEQVDLDLSDPEEEGDDSTGDHGVPDSL